MSGPLTPADLEALERDSWIDDGTAKAFGLRRVSSTEGAELVGRKDREDYSGIVIPVYAAGRPGPREYYLRRDHPPIENGKPRGKYLAPLNRSNILMLGPGESVEALGDTSQPVLIVEGLKKLLAAYRLARYQGETPTFLACGLNGVYGYRGTVGKVIDATGARVDEKGVIHDFGRITWKGRGVVVIFDSDCATNKKVAAARRDLIAELKKREAHAVALDLPALDELNKTGFDDFLAQRGPEEALSLIQATTINSASAASTGERKDGLVKDLADEILRENHFARDVGGQLYVFEQGCYRPHGQDVIARLVKTLLLESGDTKHWSSHVTREVIEYLRVDAPCLLERPSPNILNIRNGLLDLTTGILRPHDPAYHSPVQLPVLYDPMATCPRWETFISQVLSEDCRVLLFEVIASAMHGDISDQQAVLLVGEGQNGKSTALRAVVSFLGEENVSGLPLHRLEADRFAASRLLGKLANICADLPAEHLSGTSTFKALTGGDRLLAERKFQQSFEFISFARLLFSANTYPQSKDASHAFFRRWLVIPFDVAIDPRDRNPALAEELAKPQELSGVLNRALGVLPGFVQRRGFSQSETTRMALMEFREMTDPLAAWLDRFTIMETNRSVSRKDLTIAYNAQAAASGRPPMSPKALCQAVRRLRPTVKDAQRSVCGQMQWVFLGLGLHDLNHPASMDSHDSHDFPVSAEGEEEEKGNLNSQHSRDSHHFPEISESEPGRNKGKVEEQGENIKLGNGVNAVNPVSPPPSPCLACRSERWWRSIHGTTVCGVCHPPAVPELVESWIR